MVETISRHRIERPVNFVGIVPCLSDFCGRHAHVPDSRRLVGRNAKSIYLSRDSKIRLLIMEKPHRGGVLGIDGKGVTQLRRYPFSSHWQSGTFNTAPCVEVDREVASMP